MRPVSWMDSREVIPSENSQPQKDAYCVIPYIYIELVKYNCRRGEQIGS